MTTNIFQIDPKRPEPIGGLMGNAPRFADAIELGFPMDADDAVVLWNDIPIPLNYKYDLSVILDDVLNVLNHCLKDMEIKTWFASNTFTTQWIIDTQNEIVKVHANWRSVVGKHENRLNKVPDIEVSKIHFLQQWSGILETAISGVHRTTLIIEDPQQLNDTETLIEKISVL